MKTIHSFGLLLSALGVVAGCSADGAQYKTEPGPDGQPAAGQPAGGQPGSQAGGNTGSDPTAPAPVAPAGKAMIRVVHASADAPQVDVYAKGSATPLVTGLGYGQTSSWIEVASGKVEVELRASPSTASSPLVYTTGALTLPDTANVTAVAAGLLSSSDTADGFRVVPVVNAFAAAAKGTTRVRVLHAGADAPAVGLDVGNDDPTMPEVASLARFADTGASGVALPSGKPLAIGIDAGGARVTAFTTPALPDGGDVLLIATGLLGKLAREGGGFSILAVGSNGNLGFIKQDPIIYTLHASPDAPAVDAFVGEAKIIDNLSFGKLTAPIQVQPGSYGIDVFAHGAGTARPSGSPALAAQSGKLMAGERYLTVATGFLAQNTLSLQAAREGFDLTDGAAHLRVVHSSPDAPAVDVGLLSAAGTSISPLFSNIKFGGSSSDTGVSAMPASLPIGVTPTAADSTVVARFTVPAAANERAFVVAAGALSPPHGAQGFRLAVVDTAQSPWTVSHVFAH